MTTDPDVDNWLSRQVLNRTADLFEQQAARRAAPRLSVVGDLSEGDDLLEAADQGSTGAPTLRPHGTNAQVRATASDTESGGVA